MYIVLIKIYNQDINFSAYIICIIIYRYLQLFIKIIVIIAYISPINK